MDKETLSNYGWIVVLVLILAVMLALATPFGTFIAGAIKSTTAGFFSVNQGALGAAGITIPGQNMGDATNNETIAYDHNTPELHPTGIDLDGTGRTTPQHNDTYTYGNYRYTYMTSKSGFSTVFENGGWEVRCINNVADPGAILESINGEPIVSMHRTFESCPALTVAPVIPINVKVLDYTFHNCSLLVDVSHIEIPVDVVYMNRTFDGCLSLTTIKELSYCTSLTNTWATFGRCTSLTSKSTFASSVIMPDEIIYMGCTQFGYDNYSS